MWLWQQLATFGKWLMSLLGGNHDAYGNEEPAPRSLQDRPLKGGRR
jgi:hypothetical protein